MTRLKLLVAVTSVVVLSLSETPTFGQYYPGASGYHGPSTSNISPYLNLGRGNGVVDNVLNYQLRTLPEQDRRFQQGLTNFRLNNVEQRERALERPRDPEIEDVLPGVPTAGFSYGRRSYRDYFREDFVGGIGAGRRLPSSTSSASSYYRR